MKKITELEQNVDLIEIDGRKIHLIGTAHVSRSSAGLVEKTISELKPDTVCLELCQPRYESLRNPDRWQNMDVFEVIKSGKAYVLMAQLVLAGFQKRLAKQFGIKPGEEIHSAISAAEALGSEIYLADRNIRTTLRRAWAKAGFWSISKVIASLITSFFVSEEISEEDIEALKSGDMLNAVVNEFSEFLPGVKQALIDERDEYLAAKILQAPGQNIVAVVGAGHAAGIKRVIGSEIDLAPLEHVPPRSIIWRILAWGVPALIIAIFCYGFLVGGTETSGKMLVAWVLANGSLSALGALIALGHPLTIITAFVAAPITSLNPTIAAGWVCGLVEALLRKPRVKDLEALAEDMTSVRGLWFNRVTKVLLVIILANLGSIIGTYLGAAYISSLLF